jgi:hypothetical protein
MNRRYRTFLALCVAVVLAGCGGGKEPLTQARRQWQSAPPAAQRAVEAVGGLDTWGGASRVEADMLLQLRLADGTLYVNAFHLRLEMTDRGTVRVLRAKGYDPAGTLEFTVVNGLVQAGKPFSGSVLLHRQLRTAMKWLSWYLGGPYHLLDPRAELGRSQPALLAGEHLLRIPAYSEEHYGAFYLKIDNSRLRYVISRQQDSDDSGQVARYEYQHAGDGMLFPERLEIRQIGEYATWGEQKILEASFTNVRISPKIK